MTNSKSDFHAFSVLSKVVGLHFCNEWLHRLECTTWTAPFAQFASHSAVHWLIQIDLADIKLIALLMSGSACDGVVRSRIDWFMATIRIRTSEPLG